VSATRKRGTLNSQAARTSSYHCAPEENLSTSSPVPQKHSKAYFTGSVLEGLWRIDTEAEQNNIGTLVSQKS
jgi:hypothetical protein